MAFGLDGGQRNLSPRCQQANTLTGNTWLRCARLYTLCAPARATITGRRAAGPHTNARAHFMSATLDPIPAGMGWRPAKAPAVNYV